MFSYHRLTKVTVSSQEFPGNNDGDSPVVNIFPEAISARYFRIIPLDYQKKAGLRLEMLGCYHPYLCQEPLGMESGAIYDFQITASSSLNPELSPVNSRLDSDTAWVPELGDREPYVQVDLIVPTNITGLMTRGRNDANEWVKTYEIAYSDDGEHWIDPDDLSGNEKVGNHGSIPITIDCNVVAFIVFEEGFHQPIKRTKQSVFLDVTVFRHTLVDFQMRQFCLLT
ncbi:EGF-like repeat and discoidin I-like domain-containing protein 3 [Trichonephila clavipes]|nr:EGF-like repeat and discoidin I-like domain-containing protein 3 [Trichonephila clavipes]